MAPSTAERNIRWTAANDGRHAPAVNLSPHPRQLLPTVFVAQQGIVTLTSSTNHKHPQQRPTGSAQLFPFAVLGNLWTQSKQILQTGFAASASILIINGKTGQTNLAASNCPHARSTNVCYRTEVQQKISCAKHVRTGTNNSGIRIKSETVTRQRRPSPLQRRPSPQQQPLVLPLRKHQQLALAQHLA